jgi:hypothetical protein
VNHGAVRQGIAAWPRKKKTQGSSSITRKTLQTQIRSYAGIIMKCTRLRDFHGRPALGRPTASVFHLMRVMERGLQQFGKTIGVLFADDKNWQNILDEINKKIKAMDHKLPETKNYAALASYLYNVKIAWRNEVMHPKQTYTLDEAKKIFDCVDVFLRELATIL